MIIRAKMLLLMLATLLTIMASGLVRAEELKPWEMDWDNTRYVRVFWLAQSGRWAGTFSVPSCEGLPDERPGFVSWCLALTCPAGQAPSASEYPQCVKAKS